MPSRAPSSRAPARRPAPLMLREHGSESSRSHDVHAELRHRVVSLSALMTIVWVSMVFLAFGGALVLLRHGMQLRELRDMKAIVRTQDLELQVQDWRISELEKATGTVPSKPMEAIEPAMPTPALAPMPPETTGGIMLMTSPSGTLVRGTTSPDGTKFAGFNEVGARRGIAVEILDPKETRKIRYIVLFSPSESSGTSVRWKDAQTVEYDVVLKNSAGTTKTETREVKIFF